MVKFGTSNFGINLTGAVEETEPTAPAVDLDPIEYVHHIRKINPGNNGRPIDIRNARQMTKADLRAADPRDIEMLFRYGVSQSQLAKIYDTPTGSLGKVLKDIGVDTGVKLLVKEKFGQSDNVWRKKGKGASGAMPEPDEVVTDPNKIAEFMTEPVPEPDDIAELKIPCTVINTVDANSVNAFLNNNKDTLIKILHNSIPEPPTTYTWFNSTPKPGVIPMLTVMENGKISLPIVIRKQFDRVRIGFAGPEDDLNVNVLVVGKTDNPEIGPKTSLKQAKVSYSVIADKLVLYGEKLPASYKMSWNEPEQLWTGVLIP